MSTGALKKPTIGVLAGAQVYYGTILGHFIGPLLHGVCSAASDRQCNLLMACGMDNSYTVAHPAWPVAAPDVDYVPVGPWNTDGLLVINPLFSEARSRYVQELISAGHPIVFATTGETGPTIAIDNHGGIHQAVLHLMAHGHQRVAFIAGYPNDMQGDSGLRLKAFKSAMSEYGLASDECLIAFGSHGVSGGEQAMREILSSGLHFTAVLASNDESAMGAMGVLKEAGFRIPQDVAVIGMDDSLGALTQTPPLTTFHSSPFRMGYQALESLLDFIEGRKPSLGNIDIPMQFIARQSCGCQPSAVPHIVFEDSSEAAVHPDRHAIAAQIARSMAQAVMTEARRSSYDEVQARCSRLVEAFIDSLERGDSAPFREILEEILLWVEEIEDEIHIWYTALSTLEGSVGLLRNQPGFRTGDEFLAEMIREARVIVLQGTQRQYRRSIIRQEWIADQAGQLNARLLSAMDEAQVYEILAKYLPNVGIQHVGVAFFEEHQGEPRGQTLLRKVSGLGEIPGHDGIQMRFPSSDFPPRELYEEPFRLILLPMAGRQEMSGFVAFDAAKLEICANIVWQLVTFLKVVRLYEEATDGRRLAEEADRLKSRFLSTVSHELRTPLSLITGLSGMLLQDEQDQDAGAYRRDLKRIHASAQHLDGLIRDVLDLARTEMGQLRLVCEPLNIAEAFELVCTVGAQLAQDKGLEWQSVIPADVPRVWGDRTRLRQVALNLINNAVKFTSRGKIIFRVTASPQAVTVAVSDTGLGILAEEQDVIFDEFRQSERTTLRGYGGLGLGLAICKRLVEMHAGSIGVRSSGEEGVGSTFYFTLPAMADTAEPAKAEAPSLSRMVLVLADQAAGANQLSIYLIERGFYVDVVKIDAEVDWFAAVLKSPPGAIILEQRLAASETWGILRALRDDPVTQDIPVLFYSLDELNDSGSLLELNYLMKPMSRIELIRALDRRGLKPGMKKSAKVVLIVDDDQDSLDMNAQIVTAWSPGCRILKAVNGNEALATLRATRPDLVLLDLMMPELDGFGVLDAMRSNPRSWDVPVLVLTGKALSEEEMSRFNRGVTNVLSKDLFSVHETLAHLEAALSRIPVLGGDAQRAVRRAVAFMHGHYAEPISLEAAALFVGMSKEYLARCFHQEMGITLVTYLNRYRIRRAKELLGEGGRSLTEIAMETGFSSSTYFSRVFRQEVGVSPSEFEHGWKQTGA